MGDNIRRAVLILLGIALFVGVVIGACAGCVPEGAVKVQVFDQDAARAFSEPMAASLTQIGKGMTDAMEAVGERLTETVVARMPESPAGQGDIWGAVGSIAALYVVNQIRKRAAAKAAENGR